MRIQELAAKVAKLKNATLLVATGQAILTQVAQLCQESFGLFAILDGPVGDLTLESVARLSSILDAAAYYPWLTYTAQSTETSGFGGHKGLGHAYACLRRP